jgi:carbonic anhydrase
MNREDSARVDLGVGRRRFLQTATAVAALGVVGGGLLSGVAFADALTEAQRAKMTPEDIIAAMKSGNERFRKGKQKARNYLKEQQASAKGQYPAAVILSCIDSRAPAEVILDLGIGEVFNARVAGNIENDDILGSMEFGCKVAGAKVILVMGHTSCGAIKGAIDNVQLGNLTGLLAKIRPSVEATAFTGDRSAKNYAFVDAVARKNVEMTMARIGEKSAVLKELQMSHSVLVAGAMYNLETAAVEFFS